ncbi:MAG: exodeoxyribonuclease VII large subunit [Actinomycetota bacterium]|nr:exodeoxyribonuclease VII large subunit [Actinomycetota bacterium]
MTLPLWEDAIGLSPARTVTLIRLAGEVARSLGQLGQVAVEGEVHRPSTSRGGWVFFVLRDRAAQIDVKVPRRHVARCRAVGGERVRVTGTVEWTADRGQVHLVAVEVVPVGAGAIAALLAETRRALADAGLLTRPRRRWPLLPERIGVVCGADAAVRADIESVVTDRFPGYPVVFEETTVSGPGASGGIVAALGRLALRPGVEVVIIARGGGDPTSLLPWSSEEVCRAVVACAVPVVSAIGHDGDRPLCDEVADLRCGTPSIAAAAVVPSRAELTATLGVLEDRYARGLGARVDHSARRLAGLDASVAVAAGLDRARARAEWSALRLADAHPHRRLAASRLRLGSVDWRRPTGETLGRAAGRLSAEGRHLRALAPTRVLDRGYAVVRDIGGGVVRRADALEVGDRLDVTLAWGAITTRVEEIS